MPAIADMAFLTTSDISQRIGETDEGYLVCYDVPLARIGTYQYLAREIGLEGDQEITAYRFEEDVFDPEAMASFNGKPVTDDHPAENISAGTWQLHAKGHVCNVRRSGDLLVGDLMLTDPVLIDKVKNKVKRQISCGYDGDWVPHKEGFKQTNIRGNHVAVVDKGRAGPAVAIKDSVTPTETRRLTSMSMSELKASLLKAYIKDNDPTPADLAKVMKVLDAQPEREDEKEKGALASILDALKGHPAKDKKAKDEDGDEDDKMAAYDARLKDLEANLESMRNKDKAKDEEGEKNTEELISEFLDEEEEGEEHKKAEDSEEESEEEKKEEEAKDKKSSKDAIMTLALELKPAIAKLNSKDKAIMKDALSSLLGRTGGGKAYADIAQIARQRHAAKDSQGNDTDLGRDLGRQWAAERNAFADRYTQNS